VETSGFISQHTREKSAMDKQKGLRDEMLDPTEIKGSGHTYVFPVPQ
jgi:hypothetical protein